MDSRKPWVPPDGGYGWIITAVSFLLNVLACTGMGIFGVLYVEFVEVFNISKSLASLFSTCLIVTNSITSVLCGPLIKIYGSRAVAIVGTIITFCSYMASYFVQNYRVLYLTYGVTTGIGLAALAVPAGVVPQQYFDKKRGIASGIASAGIGFGLLVWPLFARFSSETYGWQGTMMVLSAIVLNGLPLAGLLRPIPDPNKESTVSSPSFFKLLRSAYDCSILRNKLLVMLLFSVFVYSIGHVMPFFFIVARAVYSGISKDYAEYLAAAMGLCTAISRPLLGRISDLKKVNRIAFLGCCCIAAGLCSVVSYFLAGFSQFMIYAIVYGFLSGGFISLVFPVTVTIIGVERIPNAIGLVILVGGLGMVVCPLVGGVLSDLVDVHVPFLVAGVLNIFAGIITVGIYVLQKRQKGTMNKQGNPDKTDTDIHTTDAVEGHEQL